MIGAFVVLEIIVWLFAFGLSKSNIPQNPSITWEKCEANADIMYGPIILLFIQALAVPWALMSLKNVGTAYLMKFEVSFGMLAGVFGFIFYSLLFVVMPNNDSVKLLHDFVPSITLITVHTVSIGIPTFLVLKHEYSLKTLMKWNEDDRVAFEKILSSPELFQEFKLQLARDFCIENGLFYDQYRKILPQLPPFDGKVDLTIIAGNKWDKATAMKSIENYSLEARQLILNLYRQFIASNAPHEVNIGATRKVAKKCMEQLGSLSPEIIHAIAKEVKENMLLNSYVKFKRTTQGV
ncbi:hypothetical protein BKA69DRAFT_146055 [Paraphysoderma sedebokerense]|nr:hypothetical protein BKA69DRAFT_146055 [Paraphysoderma sedebokerense]